MEKQDLITKEIAYKRNGKKYLIKCEGHALYNGCHIGGYRYRLEINILNNSNSNKTLACIMMNPSTTFPDKNWESPNWEKELGFEKFKKRPRKTFGFDSTVVNVLKMAASKSYSKVCIFNIFPYIHPTGNIAIKNYKKHQKENEEAIINWESGNCNKILVAWGSSMPKKSEREAYKALQFKYIELFSQKGIKPVYYEWNSNNKNNCPYHPSSQVNSRWTKNENGKIVEKIKNDGKPGIIQQFIDDTADFKYWKNFPENNQ